MKRIASSSFLLILCAVLCSQPKSDLRRDYVWTFAEDWLSYPLPENDAFKLVFNDADSLVIEETSFPNELWGGNSTICDENGKFLFQSNGCSVLDENNNVIPGGEFLNEGYFNDGHCPKGVAVDDAIISLPTSDSVIYLLYFSLTISSDRTILFHNHLRFAKVIRDQEGKLAVVEKDQPILMDEYLIGGSVGLTRHANGKDWWIIVPEGDSSKKFKILFGERGVISIEEQEIGSVIYERDDGSGSALFSPDGKKMAIYNVHSDLHIFDFDRCTGKLSNPIHIVINDYADFVQSAGVAFAPNSRFLYLSSTQHIYQYDLWSPIVESSKIVVGHYDGFLTSSGLTARFFCAKLAADGKIYIGSPSNRGVFHIIHQPNEQGINCKLEQHGLILPVPVFTMNIPHHPNYRLGPEKGTICDSLNIPSWLTIEAHPYDQKVCSGDKTHFEVTAFGYPLSYQWQINRDNEWKNLQNNVLFSGVKENYLFISGTGTSMEGWQFRCIVKTDTEIDTSRIAELNILPEKSAIADYELKINEDTIWVENKSKNATLFQWHYGDYLTLDSLENPPYHVYEWQEDYDSVYQFELLVQNECSNDWKRDSVSISVPKFELDFEIIESGICEDEPYVIFEDISKARNRILNRKWWSAQSDRPDRIFRFRFDENPVTFNYWDHRQTYNQTLEVCDKFRCDTLTKEEIVKIYEPIDISIYKEQRSDKVFWLNCRCAGIADTLTWFFEDGEVLSMEDKFLYEFENDSTYTIIFKASNPCETVYDTITITTTATHTDNLMGFESKINVYPNPTSSDLTIEFEEYISRTIEFRLQDLTGRQIGAYELSNSPSQQIQLSDYPSGVYFYQILVDGFSAKTDRLLIVR